MIDVIYDVIIIGAGPAGLSAALYTGRTMLKTLAIENFSSPSQLMLTDFVDNFPSYPEGIKAYKLAKNFRKHAQKFDITIQDGQVIKITTVKKNGQKIWQVHLDNDNTIYNSLSIIIDPGAKAKKLGVKGEKNFIGQGVSYCAICNGAFFKNKNVIVVGGGDTAVQEALFLTKYTAKVCIIHRRNKLRAVKFLQDQVFTNNKISFIWNSIIEKINGKNHIQSVVVKDIKTNEQKIIEADGIFIFIGYMPNTDFVKEQVECDENCWIITDIKMQTNVDGIFAAGDCR